MLANTDGTKYLVGTGGTSLSLSVLDAKTGVTTNLNINTIPDKCVWSRKQVNIVYCAAPKRIVQGVYPDDWYKGKVLFNDYIWKIDTTSGTTQSIIDLAQESSELFDATNLVLAPSEGYMAFMNKRDLTLWGLDLTR